MKGVFMRGFYALFMRLAGTILVRRANWSEWRDLNPRPLAPQQRGHKNLTSRHSRRNRLTKVWATPSVSGGGKPLFILALLALLATPLHAQSVYWNPANSVGSGHEALIQFAVQSAAERTGMAITYAGQTTAAECVANAITYRTAVVAEWNAAMDAIAATPDERAGYHGFTFVCPYGGYTLLLSPHWDVDRETVMHELVCHGLRGFGHLSFSTGALCLHNGNGHGLMTWADIDFVRASPDWPVPNAASWCHNELAEDFDLLLPQINGKRVVLNYDGVVSGFHQWTVAENVTVSNTKGCANNWTNHDGTATLNDIRGIADYASATFQPVGVSSWRLVSVTP